MRISGYFALAALAALSLSSCETRTPPAAETHYFQDDGEGFIQFSTNEDRYLGKNMIAVYASTATAAAAWEVTAEVKKLSGSRNTGYGLIFGYADENNYCVFLINYLGKYTIRQKKLGSFNVIADWSGSSRIKSDGSAELLQVKYIGENEFKFYINSLSTPVITVKEAPAEAISGQAGFFASIGAAGYEDFPWLFSDQRFRITSCSAGVTVPPTP